MSIVSEIPPRINGQRWLIESEPGEKILVEIVEGHPSFGPGRTRFRVLKIILEGSLCMGSSSVRKSGMFIENEILALHFDSRGWNYELLDGQEKPER